MILYHNQINKIQKEDKRYMKSKIIRLLSIACVILVAIPTTYSRSEEK